MIGAQNMKNNELIKQCTVTCLKCEKPRVQEKWKIYSNSGNVIYKYLDERGENWPNKQLCPTCRGVGRRASLDTTDYLLGPTQSDVDKTVKKYRCQNCNAKTTNRFNCTKCLDHVLVTTEINGVDL